MTVKECYSQMGSDYNNVLSRLYDEAMIERLLSKFVTDPSFAALEKASRGRRTRGVLCGP